jgi:hypothetical protein
MCMVIMNSRLFTCKVEVYFHVSTQIAIKHAYNLQLNQSIYPIRFQ